MKPPFDFAQLLGRPPIALDGDSIASIVRGASVLVTGAAGSIGSELCRQLCRYAPARVALVDRSEDGLFRLHRELRRDHPAVDAQSCIGDIADRRRMDAIFGRFRPSVVLHAAAYKHVPMMESCPGEAVKNNVFGTRTIADLATSWAVERFVLVSTDKAVNPASVMGATKHLAELYVRSLVGRQTRYLAVRFGNVLGSAGSVVPIFLEQIAAGGPITVTHPEMVRYFMTIPEASGLVLQAAALGQGGELFILDMGKPIRIVDLARDLARLAGAGDIPITFVGPRPGEKLVEEVTRAGEAAEPTGHPGILVGHPRPVAREDVVALLDGLRVLVDRDDQDAIRERLLACEALP